MSQKEEVIHRVALAGALSFGTMGLLFLVLLNWYSVLPLNLFNWLPGVPYWVDLSIIFVALATILYGVQRYTPLRELTYQTTDLNSLSWKASHRFTPRLSVLIRSNLLGALVFSLIISTTLLVTFFERGDPNPLFLILFCLLLGLGYILFLIGRNLWRGTNQIEVTKKSIRVSGRRGERQIRWEDVEEFDYEGDQNGLMRLETQQDERPLYVRFSGTSCGFTSEESDLLQGAILKRLKEQGLAEEETTTTKSD